MNDNEYELLSSAFEELMELSEPERATYLDNFAAAHPQLAGNLRGLVAADSADNAALESPIVAAAQAVTTEGRQAWEGRQIGAWTVRDRIADGGMGTVFKATRSEGDFEQTAAIKLLSTRFPTAEMLARFRVERQILANLNHANIASLIDGGTTDDNEPYLVMEFVDGLSIDKYCKRHKLAVAERLALFIKVCAAVEYAHQNLVVHRDIKPANILVGPDSEPKLLDFGIAKLFDAASPDATATVTEMRALTPRYASPEQLRGDPLGTATDVYSLSVLLYELLAGVGPYHATVNDDAALHHAIISGERVAPSTALRRHTADSAAIPITPGLLEGDLDNIVLKGLRAETERRYGSVRELREDIERHLRNEPVSARADTLAYRTAKFLRRRRSAVIGTAIAVGLLATSSAIFVERIVLERNVAEAARDEAESVTAFLTDLLRGADRFESAGEEITLRSILDDAAARVRTELVDQPVARAELLQIIAETYNSLSLNKQAAELSDEAYELRSRSLGAEHEDTLASLRARGHFGRLAGRDINASIALLQQALAGQISALGAGSHEVASTRNALGIAIRETGDQSGALEQFTEGYAVLTALPADHADRQFIPHFLNQIGNIQESLGETDAAIEYYERALAAFNERGEVDHPIISSLYSNIGMAHRRTGRLEEARDYLEDAIAHTRRILGEESEDYEIQLSSLGRTLGQLGDFAAANDALDRARGVALKLYGDDHPYYAWHLVNLARLKQMENDHGASVDLLNDAIPMYRRAYGEYHPFLAAAEIGFAESSLETGNVGAAIAQAQETLVRMREHPDHERHIEALGRGILGRALGEQGRDDEARELLLGSLASLREQFDDSHDLTRQVAGYLVAFLDARGETSAADTYRSLAIAAQ